MSVISSSLASNLLAQLDQLTETKTQRALLTSSITTQPATRPNISDRGITAKDFICGALWNHQAQAFLKKWCQTFPELDYAKKRLLEVLNQVIISEDMRHPDVSKVANIFMDSFSKPGFKQMLKECNIQLLKEKDCSFLRAIEVTRIWKQLTPAFKDELWMFLNSGYLMLEIFVNVPDTVIEKFERIIKQVNSRVIVNREPFNKQEFIEQCKDLIHDLDMRDVYKLTEYFWEFIISEYSPVKSYVPADYKEYYEDFVSMINNPTGRDFILQKIQPAIGIVKNKIGDKVSIVIDEKEGIIDYGEELKGESKEAEQKRREAKEQVLIAVVDVIGELLAKNEGLVQNLVQNPTEAMPQLLKKAMPYFIKMIKDYTLKMLMGNDRHEKERKHDEEKYLQGISLEERPKSQPRRQ